MVESSSLISLRQLLDYDVRGRPFIHICRGHITITNSKAKKALFQRMRLECFIHSKVKIAHTHTQAKCTAPQCANAFWFEDRFLLAGIHPTVGRFIWINGTGMCRRCGLCLRSLITNKLNQVYIMYFCVRSPPHTSRTYIDTWTITYVHTTPAWIRTQMRIC